MMPNVDFSNIKDELEEAGEMHVISVLIRSNLHHGADNRPAVLILTDKTIFWGGTADMSNSFNRIPLSSIVCAESAGVGPLECIKISHMEIDGEKTIFVTPFTGHPSLPKKDPETTKLILEKCNT